MENLGKNSVGLKDACVTYRCLY